MQPFMFAVHSITNLPTVSTSPLFRMTILDSSQEETHTYVAPGISSFTPGHLSNVSISASSLEASSPNDLQVNFTTGNEGAMALKIKLQPDFKIGDGCNVTVAQGQ